MARISIQLTRTAAAKVRDRDAVRRAAIEAYEAAGRGDILCAVFVSGGQQFALSSRTVLEVDWLPNRVPQRVLRGGDARAATEAKPHRLKV